MTGFMDFVANVTKDTVGTIDSRQYAEGNVASGRLGNAIRHLIRAGEKWKH